MGDGRAERSSAVGDGGQAACDNVRQMCELTYVIGHEYARSHL